jgi:hypothetical protein
MEFKKAPPLNMSSLMALKLDLENAYNLDYLKFNDPSYIRLDWNGSQSWKKLITQDCSSLSELCKKACFLFISSNQLLSRLAVRGREIMISNLSENEKQVFRNAGLLEESPSEDVILWWNQIKAIGRQILNNDKVEQGLRAEYWTLLIERERLQVEEIPNQPKLLSIENDSYGYDIRSFIRLDNEIIPIKIEVKSFSKRSAPHIYITANEWHVALEHDSIYFFYVWCMEDKSYKIFSVRELMGDIPINQGNGTWQTSFINIQTWNT